MEKKPGVFTTWPAHFLEKISGLLRPRGDTRISNKSHAPYPHLTPTLLKQHVLVMSQPSITEKAPNTDKITDENNVWGSLRRPGQETSMREGTPAPCPVPATTPAAQQILQRRPLPCIYPLSSALERSVRPIPFNIDGAFASSI